MLENTKSEKGGRTSAPSWWLRVGFYPQSSITMFSFDLLLTKSWRWHTGKRSLCRAVKEGKQRKHEDFFWKDAWSRAPGKDGYLLPRSIRKTHADSHAQSSAGGFTQHKHLPYKERSGANLKKKIEKSRHWCFFWGKDINAHQKLLPEGCQLRRSKVLPPFPVDRNFSLVSSFTKAILV